MWFCIERYYIGCQLFWLCCKLQTRQLRWTMSHTSFGAMEGCAVFGIFRLDELQMPW